MGGGTSLPHDTQSCAALWVGLGEMVPINGRAVADKFTQNERVTPSRAVQRFERDHSGALAQGQSIPPGIEGPAECRRERLQRIEARKNHLSQSVITAGHNALGLGRTYQVTRMTYGISARGAGVGDDGGWPAETEGIENHSRLNLRLIMNGPGGLLVMLLWLLHRLAEIILPELHAAGRRAQNQWQIFSGFPPGLLPCFQRGQHEHGPGTVNPGQGTRTEPCWRKDCRQVNLRCCFYPLTADIELRDRPERHLSGTEAPGIYFPTDAQGCDNARTCDDHARRVG